MSKIEVDAITQQSGTTLTTGGGAGKTVVVDATTVTLGRCGGTVALASGASQTGFGRTGTVDWQTGDIKTTTFTATSGEGYFANTTSGGFTMNLPAGVAGGIVSVVDYTNTFSSNNLTITPNGSDKIGGFNASATLSTDGQSVTFVFIDSTEGWKNVQDSTSNVTGNIFMLATGGTITNCGNCRVHTFTSPGTFCVSRVHPCAANNQVSYMVVGGGGGAGGGDNGGGGGAGGFREDKSPITPYTASPLEGSGTITATVTAFPIAVGGGGAGATVSSPCSAGKRGTSGSISTFSTITSAGGGGGGAAYPSSPCGNASGVAGASGGGGGHDNGAAGAGNTPPVSPPQGSNGGTGVTSPPAGPKYGGGGGGGATAAGQNGSPSKGGDGGAGATTGINFSNTTFAGGGGGGAEGGGCSSGGAGGGGPGRGCNPTSGTPGTDNTGGGGGSAGSTSPTITVGNGGSGIVIIRYKYQ